MATEKPAAALPLAAAADLAPHPDAAGTRAEDGPAASTQATAAALEVLTAILDAAGLVSDPPRTRAALREATENSLSTSPGVVVPPALQSLVLAGEALGLRWQPLQRSVRQVLASDPVAELPLCTWIESTKPGLSAGWLLLHRRPGQQLMVTWYDALGGSQPQELAAAELAKLLGASSEDAPRLWLHSEAAAPLSSLGTDEPAGMLAPPNLTHASHGHGHGGGHGHGHGGGHGHGHGHGSGLTPQRRLWNLLRSESGDLWVVLSYAAATGLLTLTTPVAVQSLVNMVSFGQLLQPVVVLTLLLLGGLGLSALLRLLQTSVVELLQQRLLVRAGADFAHRLPRAQSSALLHDHGPELSTRFFDILTVQKSLAGLLLDGLGLVLQTGIGLLVLAFYHPALLAFDVVLIAALALIIGVLGRGAVDTSVAESAAKYAVADWLDELARRPLAFKSGCGPLLAREHTDDLLRNYVEARRGHFRVLRRQIIGSLALQALASAALLGIGGALVMAGQLTIGQLVAAEIIVSSVVAGIAKFGKHLETYYDLAAAMDKLGYLLDLPLEPASGQLLPSGQPAQLPGAAVKLLHVSAGYQDGTSVLHGLTFSLLPGERAAVTGPSGSGKSLLCDLLFGLQHVQHGLLELDGHELRALRPTSLRKQVALLRDTRAALFAGTIEDNLRCGDMTPSLQQLRAALVAVGLWEHVASQPEGLRTQLVGGAPSLSDGAALRLCAARVLLQQPRLLLIDGAFAARCAMSHSADDQPWLDALLGATAPWTVLLFASADNPLLRYCGTRYFFCDGQLESVTTAVDSSRLSHQSTEEAR